MLKILKWLIISVFLLSLLVVGLVASVLETEPDVVTSATRQIDDADSVNRLLTQIKQITQRRYVRQNIVLSQQQLNSLAGFAQRAIPDFTATVSTEQQQLTYSISYRLPAKWTSVYINVDGKFLAGKKLHLGPLNVGGLTISGERALDLLTWLVNWRTDSDLGTLAVEQVEGLAMTPNHTIVQLKPINELLVKLNQIKKGLAGNEDQALRIRTAYYLAYLDEMPVARQKSAVSLAQFMGPLFAEVTRRSELQGALPSEENESALLALAIYTGHHRLANLVGDVQPYAGEVVLPRFRPLLANRTDLTQHFVISAAIKILSMQGISNAIGEFKELMDRGQGGSGFSFADLAADLAGVELAVRSADPNFARAIQHKLANLQDESMFFPSIEGLPEGLSKMQFKQQIGEVESDAYKQLASIIKSRITSLPLYQQ